MKVYDIYFSNEDREDKMIRTIALDKSNAKVNFIEYRKLEIEHIQKIVEWPVDIQCISGRKYKVSVKEIEKPKKIEFGAIEFKDMTEIINKM